MIYTYGSNGTEVIKIQQKLMSLGYQLPQYGDDGSFGDETARAVRSFQTDNGLTDSGVVDVQTYNKLIGESPVIEKTYNTKSAWAKYIEAIAPYQKQIIGAGMVMAWAYYWMGKGDRKRRRS